MIAHGVLLFANIYIYSFEVMLIVADVAIVGLDVYNYRQVQKVPILVEVILLAFTSVVALTHFQRVFFADKVYGIVIIFYLVQFFLINPILVALMAKRLGKVFALHRELKDIELQKTLKGKIEVAARKKA